MVLKKAGLCSLTLAFTMAALAQGEPPAEPKVLGNYGMIDLPTCVDTQGRPAIYIARTLAEMRDQHIGLAAAWHDSSTGQPYIEYDSERLPRTAPKFQAFVFAHECAHHTLGHTDLHPGEYTHNKEALEEDADCTAFKSLNYGRREIDLIAATNNALYPTITVKEGTLKWDMSDRRDILTRCMQQHPQAR